MDYKVVFTTMGKTLWHFGPMCSCAISLYLFEDFMMAWGHMISYIFALKDISSKWEHYKRWKFSF
jgi:hypothetical protein